MTIGSRVALGTELGNAAEEHFCVWQFQGLQEFRVVHHIYLMDFAITSPMPLTLLLALLVAEYTISGLRAHATEAVHTDVVLLCMSSNHGIVFSVLQPHTTHQTLLATGSLGQVLLRLVIYPQSVASLGLVPCFWEGRLQQLFFPSDGSDSS